MEIIEIGGITITVTHQTAERIRREREEMEAEARRPEEMRRLAFSWLIEGDEMSGDIWSDLWKDQYGCRPRYTRDEVRAMYGF